MARSVVVKETPYVLEVDRSLPVEEQTIFHLTPKTVKSLAHSASRYAKVQRRNIRKNRDEIDVNAMRDADNKEFTEVVSKIENYFMAFNAPEKGYEHFLAQVEDNPKFTKMNDGTIHIEEATSQADLLAIFWTLDPKDADELGKAAGDQAVLKEGTKNS